MIDVTGDLWTYPADFRVITTNGTIKGTRHAVLGRGCAREAAQRYPRLAGLLGRRIAQRGNIVHFFSDLELGDRVGLFTFPVKHQWYEKADPALIAQSVAQFAGQLLPSATYVMPRPGCGNGQLFYSDVRPLLLDLPDNVHVITFREGNDHRRRRPQPPRRQL